MKATDTKSTVLLHHHLKSLRLPTVAAECEKVATQAAADNADHLSYLLRLTELELLEREKRSAERRVKFGALSDHQDARDLRLRRPALGQQGAGRRADAL